MADDPENDPKPPDSSAASAPGKSPSRRKPITPELRRFLGPGRSWHEREAEKEEISASEQPAPDPVSAAPEQAAFDPWPAPAPPGREPPNKPDRQRTPPPMPAVLPDQKMSRVLEMQKVALILGMLVLLGAAFYAGTKIRSVKGFLASQNKPEIAGVDAKKFPGLSSDELVQQAMAAERLGNWREAVERLLVAKRRNHQYRDLVFHAAKLCYDHADFDGADRLLERAIAFGEQVDTANYLRGLIAVGRSDLPAAEQFFEAAINAEPFTPGYYYYLGETLRREHRPKEAIDRYEEAAARTANEQDALLCRFKALMAKAETVDRSQLENEVERKRSSGPLTGEWLLTDAALKIRAGQIAEAVPLIEQAKGAAEPRMASLFASFTADMLFTEAANNHPEIAQACRLGSAPATATATASPFGTP
ncbi:MAG TPA: hypothetical protein VGM62_02535 [Chthoniobacterales bacterium]|jgi:tetratricopeptide (TPR) repeat protein